MNNHWKSDADLKGKAKNFFELARDSVVRDSAQLLELFSRNSFRMLGGLMFGLNEETLSSQNELITRCIKLLGAKIAHENEIENIAWDCVQKSLSGGEVSSDIQIIISRFIEALNAHVQQHYQYVSPNYSIRFIDTVKKLHIGPVEALLASELLPEISRIHTKFLWSIGSKFKMQISAPGGVSFEFPPVMWRVSLQAAQGHIEEEAIWLINIAVSLLRLSYPSNHNYRLFPNNGEKESNPIYFSLIDKQGISFSEAGISYGGTSIGKLYEIDNDVIKVTESPAFQDKTKAIFCASKGSLGERFGQGLGWLSRGRQSSDRAEKFLFFFTAIEALLSSDDKTAPVVQTISRYVAVILQDDVKLRYQLANWIKTLYATRSALVHAGKRDISNSDVNVIQHVAENTYWVVMDRIKLATSFNEFHSSLSEASYGLHWMPKQPDVSVQPPVS